MSSVATGSPRTTRAGNPMRLYAVTMAFILVMALVPAFLSPHLVSGFTRVLIYGLAACAVGFTIRYGGMVSFGHAAYFGIGAYAVLILQLSGVNEALVVWPVAAAAAGVLGLAVGAMSLRTRGVSFIMITLSFAQMIYFIISSIQELGASDGLVLSSRNTIAGMPLGAVTGFHYVVLVLAALILFVMIKVSASPLGLALNGTRQNERRLVALGFDTYRIQLVCFTFSAAITGLAGALAANFYLFVSPSFLHWLVSGEFLVMAALGGLGSLAGGFFGALLIVGAEGLLADLTTYWRIILGPVVILAVLFFNRGLEPALRKILRLSDD